MFRVLKKISEEADALNRIGLMAIRRNRDLANAKSANERELEGGPEEVNAEAQPQEI
jgi:hypothetical protein